MELIVFCIGEGREQGGAGAGGEADFPHGAGGQEQDDTGGADGEGARGAWLNGLQ